MKTDKKEISKLIVVIVLLLTTMVIGCKVMTLSPAWNGQYPAHRNQYEETAIAFKEGHLWLNDEVDPVLLTLENPYDFNLRVSKGASVEWDHAFYNGHYYMYFGVVPVILLFLPYLLITGRSLVTVYGTMAFFCLGVVGLYRLFSFIQKKFFGNMPFIVKLILLETTCAFSYWYVLDAPALYCTAISAGICLEVWSINFVLRSIYDDKLSHGKASAFLVLGAFLGALVFGCRPPIGLSSIIMLPFFVKLVKRHRKEGRRIIFLLLKTVLPYLLVALALMLYNYARFDNPLEFGQSYQMTVADQTNYSSMGNTIGLRELGRQFVNVFWACPEYSLHFPYIYYSGIFMEFPLLLGIVLICLRKVIKTLKDRKLLSFSLSIIISVLVMFVMELMMSPAFIERYKLDFNFLLGILCFTVLSAMYQTVGSKGRKYLTLVVLVLAFISLINSMLLFLIPMDENFTEIYPWVYEKICNLLP